MWVMRQPLLIRSRLGVYTLCIVGKINNAYVCIENCLPESDTAHYNILRTDKAVAFAEQIDKVVDYMAK